MKRRMYRAAIFDMDGLLIDTDHMWQNAEREVFGSAGIEISDQEGLITRNMTTSEATRYWYHQKPWKGASLWEMEQAVIKKVIDYIDTSGCPLPGVYEVMDFFKSKDFLIGLATNAPGIIAQRTLAKLGIGYHFREICSSDAVPKGKPSPDVYLYAADKLQVETSNCIAFEDSPSGLAAAKAAGMCTVLVSKNVALNESQYDIADMMLHSLEEFDNTALEKLMQR